MKKIKKTVILAIALIMLFAVMGLAGCDNRRNPAIDYGYFRVELNRQESYAIVFGLTDLGREQEILAVPMFVEGLPVRQIGRHVGMLGATEGIASQNLRKLYIPYNVTNTPAITVLTHGLSGSASHWSNTADNRFFAYDNRSLIERLRRQNGANVFWAQMNSATNFRLFELPIQNQLQIYDYNNLPTVPRLTFNEINRHMVIVFESTRSAAAGSHDQKRW